MIAESVAVVAGIVRSVVAVVAAFAFVVAAAIVVVPFSAEFD